MVEIEETESESELYDESDRERLRDVSVTSACLRFRPLEAFESFSVGLIMAVSIASISDIPRYHTDFKTSGGGAVSVSFGLSFGLRSCCVREGRDA